MAENVTQSYANHARWHPPFHFFLAPGSLVLLILTIVNGVRHYRRLEAWILVLMGVLFFVAVFLLRVNPLRAQDRVIRLEERLRFQAQLPAQLNARFGELTESQVVALRFASDAELAALVERVLTTKTPPGDIKKAIVTWRADTFRV
jgi:uncharacterized coiled-coil protein SlyX